MKFVPYRYYLAAVATIYLAAAAHGEQDLVGPAPTGDAASGEFVFDEKCGTCHLASGSSESGPSLYGVAGRKAAFMADFPYTAGMKAAGLTWDDATLDRFLASPGVLVPGTNMKRALPDPADRADVIAYVKTLKE